MLRGPCKQAHVTEAEADVGITEDNVVATGSVSSEHEVALHQRAGTGTSNDTATGKDALEGVLGLGAEVSCAQRSERRPATA